MAKLDLTKTPEIARVMGELLKRREFPASDADRIAVNKEIVKVLIGLTPDADDTEVDEVLKAQWEENRRKMAGQENE